MNAYRLAYGRVAAALVCGAAILLAATPAWAQGERPIDTTRKDMNTGIQMEAAPLSAPKLRTNVGGGVGHFSSPTLGATVGGAQDIGYARKLIEMGRIPQFLDFSPEGLYSEHDIPTPSSTCDDKLCLSLGYGYAPTADNNSSAMFVHLGMSSNIRPQDFRRMPQQLALVIDKSGSMEGASMDAVKKALHALVARLGPDDEILLVQFNDDAQMVLTPVHPGDHAGRDQAIAAAIDALQADGGTDIESGLKLGFEKLAALPTVNGVSKRLMLFTDAMPNVGRTDSTSFRMLAERYAHQGIGLTAFGVGIDFGQELTYHISQLRGGNFFYLESPQKIATVFDNEFDYLVTPLAYDLDVTIATPAGLKLTAVYGLPTWKPGSHDANLHIPTVFLSSNRGAIVLRYEKDGSGALTVDAGDQIASGTIGFTDVDGSRHGSETVLRHTGTERLEPGTQYYTHDGMRVAVALTNVFFGLNEGCRLVAEGKREQALDVISRARGIAKLENAMLSSSGLATEIALLDKLQDNIEKGNGVRQPAHGEIPVR